MLKFQLLCFSAHFMKAIHASVQNRRDSNSTFLGEWIRNIRLIRSLSWQHVFQNEISANVREVVKAGAKEHLIICFIFGLSFCWWMLPVGTLVLAALVLESQVELSTLFASVWLLNHLSSGMQHIPNTITKYGAASACLGRIDALLQSPNLEYKPSGRVVPSGALKAVHLSDVSVEIEKKSVLKNLNFSINFTQKTAVIGSVGSGKTTLLRILSGDLPPTHGSVWVEFENGTRADLWEKEISRYYRARIALAPQEPFLSNTTFANNISLETSTPAAEVMQAAVSLNSALLPSLSGDLCFENFSMSYRQDTPIILSGLSLRLGEGKKIGIIGRTGAGKTSIVQSVFRMVYVHEGDVTWGGVSLYDVELHHLRRQLGIVPQSPYLFEGTVRTNLDRARQYTDAELLKALASVSLALPLDAGVREGGVNYSLGERLLLCLARILVSDKKIVFMDEPTSAVCL